MTALDLIRYAFEVIERDVVGDFQGWVKTTRFDVLARTSKAPLSPSRLRAMTKALLEDRFRLDWSREQEVGRIFALVSSRPDGGTPRLNPSKSECQLDAPFGEAIEGAQKILNFSEKCGITTMTLGGALTGFFGQRVTMQEVARALSRVGGFDRPVIDKTKLTGHFDFFVVPTEDMVAPTTQARFLIALREQLGLTLRSEEGSFEVLRIRRIDQPSPN